MGNLSKVLKSRGFRWHGVELNAYKQEDAPYQDVTRQTLLGEGPGEEVLQFITRYFEVQPGGYSTLELHHHPHSVVVLRGSGQVVLGNEMYEIGPYDCVYVAPGTKHQFRATGTEPLGFLCVVDRVRDRPQVVTRCGRCVSPAAVTSKAQRPASSAARSPRVTSANVPSAQKWM